MSDRWIVVPNWDKFQHYADRDPTWIKLYTELNSQDEWLELSAASRGVLTTIWVEYARSRGVLSAKRVMQLCGKSARSNTLVSLSDAGFIQVSASRPLAFTRSREEEKSKKKKRAAKERPVNISQPQTPEAEPELIDYHQFLETLKGKAQP